MELMSGKAKLRALASGVAAGALTLPAVVFGQEGPASVADLAAAVDFDDVAPGILGVAAALITLYVIIKGVRIVIGFVRAG